MKKVIIMRGLPGSGKSTYIKDNYPDAIVCSADHFWIQEDGSYKFNVNKLGEAHKCCYNKFKGLLNLSNPLVIVDNTNTSEKEMRNYKETAYSFNYQVELIYCKCSVETSVKRNIHNVPRATIEKMAARLENQLPSWWPKQIIIETD